MDKRFIGIVIAGLVLAGLSFVGPLSAEEGKAKPCDLADVQKIPCCWVCEIMEPKVDDDGLCEACGEKPEPRDVCVKVTYACKGCGMEMASDEPCCEGKTNERHVDRAFIIYVCPGCDAEGEVEGEACWSEACADAGLTYVRTCRNSGTWPHGGEQP